MIEIGPPRPGDIGRIIALHGETYVGKFGYPPIFEHHVVAAFADLLDGFSEPEDGIFVVRRDGALIGSIATKRRADGWAQLRFLILTPEARGMKLGNRLVSLVVDHARDAGRRGIILQTASDLAAARAVYTAHGFTKTGEETVDWLPEGVVSESWSLALISPRAASENPRHLRRRDPC